MKKKPTNSPKPAKEMLVTVSMMEQFEGRLIQKIQGVHEDLNAKIHGVRSEIHELKSDIHGMKSELHGMKSELHRVALLVEEQNARNKYVMDGYAQIYDLLTRDRDF